MIILVDDEGNEILFNILFMFDLEDFGYFYILLYLVDVVVDDEVDI